MTLRRAVLRRAGPARPLPWRTLRCPLRPAGGVALLLLVLAGATVAEGAGGKVLLTRKYRAGQSMVYVTKVHTNSKIDSNPPGLEKLLPAHAHGLAHEPAKYRDGVESGTLMARRMFSTASTSSKFRPTWGRSLKTYATP